KRGDYVVKVNNRKILDGVLEAIGLGGDGNAGPRLTVMRAIDKLDRLGERGVREVLGAGRKGGRGGFTKGAGLDEAQTYQLLSFLTIAFAEPKFSSHDDDLLFNRTVLASLNSLKGLTSSQTYQNGLNELNEIAHLVASSDYGYSQIRVDPSVVRGLEYYTGPVYEIELTFGIKDDDGRTVRFGSVAGGGRYDGLVGRLRDDQVRAAGFSIGVSRLTAALIHLSKIDAKSEAGPVVVTVFDKDRLADYQRMTQTLRNAGIRAELYLGSGKMGPQLKYADKRGAPCVVIQ